MASLHQLLAEGTATLERAGIAEPRLTAEVLLAHVLGRERSYLYAHPEQEAAPAVNERWQQAMTARAAGTPLQYITGAQEFYGRLFAVSPAVLIPRPETELTVQAVLDRIPAGAPARVLDVGTGSGCIAVTVALERPRAAVFAADISTAALAVARANAAALGAPVSLFQSDLMRACTGPFAIVVSNPPYVADGELAALRPEVREHEPRLALTAGPEGNEIYRRLIPQAWNALAPSGWLVLEMGYASARALTPVLAASGWRDISTTTDTLGWQRVLCARR